MGGGSKGALAGAIPGAGAASREHQGSSWPGLAAATDGQVPLSPIPKLISRAASGALPADLRKAASGL